MSVFGLISVDGLITSNSIILIPLYNLMRRSQNCFHPRHKRKFENFGRPKSQISSCFNAAGENFEKIGRPRSQTSYIFSAACENFKNFGWPISQISSLFSAAGLKY